MRIATYYESRLGRNDGPPLYWTHAMKQLGHDVTHFSSQFVPNEQWGKFDLHIWVDWGEDSLTGILGYKPISMKNLHPSMYVTSDTHLGYEYRLNKAKEFDFVFCNQQRAVEEFAKDGVKAFWLPHAVEPQAYPNTPVAIKKCDIGFVGYVTFEKRARMLDRMFREFPSFWYGQRLFEAAAEIYRKSRIVFNTAAVDDVNMRVFEVTATGSFLLTEWVPTLATVGYIDGINCATYKDMDEAVNKARYYLEHEKEREEIAKKGMEWCLLSDTYQNRIKEAFAILEKQTQGGITCGRTELGKENFATRI